MALPTINNNMQSFSHERYQRLLQTQGLIPAVGNLKDAAATVILEWLVPAGIGSITIKAMGGFMQAAGGAQTTAGTAGLYINGTIWKDEDDTNIVISSVASHLDNSGIETSLNATLTASELESAPDYPVAVAGDLVQMKVVTQGVGAGDQTLIPYLLYSETPGQTS